MGKAFPLGSELRMRRVTDKKRLVNLGVYLPPISAGVTFSRNLPSSLPLMSYFRYASLSWKRQDLRST